MTDILVGCDPELFVFDKTTDKVVSAHNLLSGTKSNPFKVPMGAFQVDGIAAEFNIEPAKTRPQFLKNIKHVQRVLSMALLAKSDKYILKAVPSVTFDQTFYDNLPEEAVALGCEPDYNAYTMSQNMKPAQTSLMRTGSGHVHIGWTDSVEDVFDEKHLNQCCDVVRALDSVLAYQSNVWDSDTTRRQLYGKPGDFRPKSYGVEYRTLSNAWLNETWTMMFVYDATVAVTKAALEGVDLPKELDGYIKFSDYIKKLDSLGIPSVANYAPEGIVSYASSH